MKKLPGAGVFGVVGSILLACGSNETDGQAGQNGTAGAKGQSVLVNASAEPAGTNCPTGGTRLRAGLDADGNGNLDDPEVTSTTYACNGAGGANGKDGEPGASTLVTIGDEPAGTQCPAGGKRIDAGTDDDRDGTLDTAEIDRTTYVCNGADGTNGTSSIVAVTDEGAGTNCPGGGKKIQSGIDDDGNGTLDPAEVDRSSYVCNGTNGTSGIVKTSKEAAGVNCAFGGQRIESGSDDNGNGALDAAEVDQTSYVCDGGTCDGKRYKGYCWYLGVTNTSCTTVCSPHGGYDDATRTITGSAGTLADCSSVLSLLGTAGATNGDGFGNAVPGVGCAWVANQAGIRYVSFTTTADAAFTTSARVCACRY